MPPTKKKTRIKRKPAIFFKAFQWIGHVDVFDLTETSKYKLKIYGQK